MSHPLWSEIRECLVQEACYLIASRIHRVGLPVPVLTGAGTRSHPLRQQKGLKRADRTSRKSST